MREIRWSEEKNKKLLSERGVCFEDVLVASRENKILDSLEHPNKEKYPHQKILIVEIRGYVYVVPCVKTKREIFLKTIIPSRKYTKQYCIDKK